MNPAIYFLLFLPIILVLIQQKKNKNWTAQYLKLKQGKENHIMREAAEKFIDKECYFYLLSGEVEGILREVTDHSLLIETQQGMQALNLDFVIRIREYPKNKHGKKKSIVLD